MVRAAQKKTTPIIKLGNKVLHISNGTSSEVGGGLHVLDALGNRLVCVHIVTASPNIPRATECVDQPGAIGDGLLRCKILQLEGAG